MSTVARLLLVICACAAARAFAAGSVSDAVEEPAPSATAAPSASSIKPSEATSPHPSSSGISDAGTQPGAPGTSPAPRSPDTATADSGANKPAKVVLIDDTVTADQLKQILAKGYKPEAQARGNEVYYCRRERPLGTRFEQKICKTSGKILQDEQQGKDITNRAQRPGMDPMQ